MWAYRASSERVSAAFAALHDEQRERRALRHGLTGLPVQLAGNRILIDDRVAPFVHLDPGGQQLSADAVARAGDGVDANSKVHLISNHDCLVGRRAPAGMTPCPWRCSGPACGRPPPGGHPPPPPGPTPPAPPARGTPPPPPPARPPPPR